MNSKLYVLPALCLGGAALLLVPARPSKAYSTIGGSLGEGQRDVRVFDNFLDSTANNNLTPTAQFPGWLAVELAVWKGVVEWGSTLHGTGGGDPVSGNQLGSGGANFDAFWAGNADGIGNSNQNVVSSITTCGGGGTLAFTETPIQDGWRIRFCDEWVWDDGPGGISSRWDIQGVTTHEYGHALGLGHSTVGNATMFPSGSPGQTTLRSIEADDIAGVQFIYGVAAGTKPVIVATDADTGANTLTIYGSNFGATGNEVWFTNSTITSTAVDPIVRVTGVTSAGGVITVSIPANAGPGDVMVNKSGGGGATLSNAFPTDLVGTFGTIPTVGPEITGVSPSSIEALIPGTAKTITITGSNLDLTTSLLLDAGAISPSRYTIVNASTITLDMPQASSLGAHTLSATDGTTTSNFPVTIVVPSTPKLQWASGDLGVNVSRSAGLDVIVSGPVGSVQIVRGATNASQLNDLLRRLRRAMPAQPLVDGGAYVIPPAGWASAHLEGLPDPAIVGSSWLGQSWQYGSGALSNQQSINLLP